jgi:hypothetical protein
MSGQDDINKAIASVVANSARACKLAFEAWLAEPGTYRREELVVLMRGHELDIVSEIKRQNVELKAKLEAIRDEKVLSLARLATKPKLRLAAPEEGEGA